jgi:two-component system response regulator GlrR
VSNNGSPVAGSMSPVEERDAASRGGDTDSDEGFGIVVGRSAAMRGIFPALRRAADTDATILMEGETGTGKEATAASIHGASARRDQPFLVIDCGAIAANLLEAELFGYERGAFTGASNRHVGAFEAAGGGTVLLDEIGELPVELQPKLLRVLEQRHIRRLGSTSYRPIQVRFLAATNRDLRTQVERGQFRADLYFRLAVLRVRLPPLRERLEDIPLLVRKLLARLGGSRRLEQGFDRQVIACLQQAAWLGNVRELRNYVERCVLFDEWIPLVEEVTGTAAPQPPAADASMTYIEARRRALEHWEHDYLQEQLRRNDDNITRAASAAGIGRAYMYRLLNRHGLRTQGGDTPAPLRRTITGNS